MISVCVLHGIALDQAIFVPRPFRYIFGKRRGAKSDCMLSRSEFDSSVIQMNVTLHQCNMFSAPIFDAKLDLFPIIRQ